MPDVAKLDRAFPRASSQTVIPSLRGIPREAVLTFRDGKYRLCRGMSGTLDMIAWETSLNGPLALPCESDGPRRLLSHRGVAVLRWRGRRSVHIPLLPDLGQLGVRVVASQTHDR